MPGERDGQAGAPAALAGPQLDGRLDPETMSHVFAILLAPGRERADDAMTGGLSKCVQASLVCTAWRAAAALLNHQHLHITDALIKGRLRRTVTFEKLLKRIAGTFPGCQSATLALSKLCRPPAQWLDDHHAVHISPESLCRFFDLARSLRFLDISLPASHEPHLHKVMENAIGALCELKLEAFYCSNAVLPGIDALRRLLTSWPQLAVRFLNGCHTVFLSVR